ncbi:hypothetical protein SmJEL517_g01606 [Synchytrium microbalum]|uniref:RNA-binding S4 domain-containing protein n=1 Tax=Synchytrium microbalum TaxID=1806994 RepID=A0A507CAJ0_9FUNG|nr:uncharacterized protein SmJEL517_g01606 [Synchytrium microbalum]TPX36189.1 hypothetical protein SmJEL517_g01606 [Synchytrium microbalum]
MSWEPQYLFNLIQKTQLIDDTRRSVFQQRWTAKRDVRGYHVPNISERQLLARHFNLQLPYDPSMTRAQREAAPPATVLAFGELERRVDVVVFRSHFAKSIFQARDIVKGGFVSVNGIKCVHPATRLRDGDMITVDPVAIPTLVHRIAIEKEVKDAPSTTADAQETSAADSVKEEVTSKAETAETKDDAASSTAESKAEEPVEASSEADNKPAEPSPTPPKEPKIEYKLVPKTRNAKIPYTFKPVDYMAPWMFTPDYLEVNYPSCSTVFLRSPQSQPHRVEIPSPYPPSQHQLAYEWYARIKERQTKRRYHQPLFMSGGRVPVVLKPHFDRMVRWNALHERGRPVWKQV